MSDTSRINTLLSRGGELRVDLLRYAVISTSLEPLVLFLVSEYRLRPSVPAALAIYDLFCAENSPGRVDASVVVPSRDVRLAASIEQLRRQALAHAESVAQVRDDGEEGEGPNIVPPLPARDLFDSLVAHLWSEGGRLHDIEREYDENLKPEQNLSGGSASQAQTNFVNQVWRPHMRPVLVAAGFWQLSSID